MHLSLTIGVADLAVTMNFYRQIPGLQPQWLTDPQGNRTALLVAAAGGSILFQSLQSMERQHPALLQHLGRERLGVGVQLELTCPDLTPVYRTAQRQHWQILFELEDCQHRRRELWLQDPDGYLLVLNEEADVPDAMEASR